MLVEDRFRQVVIDEAKRLGAQVSHIESHQTSAGIPDLNIFLDLVDVWLELKVRDSKGKFKLRPTQRKWHRDRETAGGESWVMIYDPRNEQVQLYPGTKAEDPTYQMFVTVPSLGGIIHLLKYITRSYHARSSDRIRAPQDPRGSLSSFHPGGQDVGSDHWLLRKP